MLNTDTIVVNCMSDIITVFVLYLYLNVRVSGKPGYNKLRYPVSLLHFQFITVCYL